MAESVNLIPLIGLKFMRAYGISTTLLSMTKMMMTSLASVKLRTKMMMTTTFASVFGRTECVRFLLFCRCCVHVACSENNSDMLQPKLTASWEKLISDLTPLHKTLATNFTES